MAGEITKDTIVAALGDLSEKFKLERYEANGNFQITIASMGDVRDYSKMILLTEACHRLHAAELIPHPDEVFRWAWKTKEVDKRGEPIYRSYPTIWVNQTQRAETSSKTEEEMGAIRAEMAELKALLLKKEEASEGVEQPTETKAEPVAKKQSKAPSKKKKQDPIPPDAAPPEESQGEEAPFGF